MVAWLNLRPAHSLPFMRKRSTEVALMAGLATTYLLAARIGLVFDPVSGFATLVWPPTGISLAALLIFGQRVWPGVFIGAFVANFLAGAPLGVALGIAVGNTAEALIGSFLLRRTPNFSFTLERVSSVVSLIVFAALFSTLISASVGVVSLSLGHVVSPAKMQAAWRAWWIGDMVGAACVAPVFLVWRQTPRARLRAHWIEGLALGAAAVLFSVLMFFGNLPGIPVLATPFHQADVLLAILIWAALRFGQRGATATVFFVSVMAVAGTALGYGPFAHSDLHESLLLLQTFMAILAATFLLLGATIAERTAAYEDARLAHEEAERANRGKSEFLAVMSHELRTPLNAIAGYADLLKTGVYGPLNDKETDAVERIHRSERQLLAMVNEVLGFVKAEKGDVQVTPQPVQVAAAFDALEPLIQSEVQRKHFVIKRDLALPTLAVRADPKSLEQVLTRLLSNASKYTKEGGAITLGAERNGPKVRIWVRDTGIGIPQEAIQRIFDPFFQADRSTTRQYSGIGLGLTIARNLARRMAGEVTIASTVGTGTTASVTLPAA